MCWGVTRTRLRTAFNIPGNSFVDHIIVTLFPVCYLVQALDLLDAAELQQGGQQPKPAAAQPPQLVMRY
jgi:hypothetical protein